MTIFTLGLVRDYLYALRALPPRHGYRGLTQPSPASFSRALSAQPSAAALEAHGTAVRGAAAALFAAGTTLVLTSMWALGVTGTYLGDYFGILMAAPVTTFPFSVSRAPMYHGSVLSFVATALWHAKPAGLVLAALVALCYEVACAWEDPFTADIYAKRDRDAAAAKKAE